jgi:hypothetical protein
VNSVAAAIAGGVVGFAVASLLVEIAPLATSEEAANRPRRRAFKWLSGESPGLRLRGSIAWHQGAA